MELIIFIGIPGSGKSTFYKNNFFNTHVRISLDLLNTRFKESKYFELGLDLQQKMVIDNTNVTTIERKKYIEPAKRKKYTVTGYYFESKVRECIARNEARSEKINKIGILAKFKALQIPSYEEGFDNLHYVSIESGVFKIRDWDDIDLNK
jgi:predicted kinase